MPAARDDKESSPSLALPCFCLVALLLLATPTFVRMPLTNDAILFDLQTRLFSEGAVPYRDILEPNFPGVFWIHSTVRGLMGTRPEVLRLFDLVVISVVTWLLGKLLQKSGGTSQSSVWLSVAVLGFYLGTTEWCHCQRDTWLLLPILVATSLRLYRLGSGLPPAVMLCFAEGLVWGAGLWLKPYIVLIAVAVWLVTLRGFRSLRDCLVDTAWILLGGLVAGVGGITWLVQTEAWPYWIETVQQWNPRYLAAGREHWVWPRFKAMAWRMQPWFALHLVAFPLAAFHLRTLWQHSRDSVSAWGSDLSQLAMSAIYLATMTHVFLLQHLFDYVHAPAVLLAVAVVGMWLSQSNRSPHWRLAVLTFGLLALISSPILHQHRIRLWFTCVTQPSNPKLQDRLALLANPNRNHIERVADFLQKQAAHDSDVCVYNSDLVGLYQNQKLKLRPPSRYVYLFELLTYFPDNREEIISSVANSAHRFIVTDLASCGMPLSQAMAVGPEGPNAPPPAYHAVNRRSYPWSHLVVFRSGTYLVHEITAQTQNSEVQSLEETPQINPQPAD